MNNKKSARKLICISPGKTVGMELEMKSEWKEKRDWVSNGRAYNRPPANYHYCIPISIRKARFASSFAFLGLFFFKSFSFLVW